MLLTFPADGPVHVVVDSSAPTWLAYAPVATAVVALLAFSTAFAAWRTARKVLVRDTHLQLAEVIEVLTLGEAKDARMAFSTFDHTWQTTGDSGTTVEELMPHYFVLVGAIEQSKLRLDALRRTRWFPWFPRRKRIDKDVSKLVGWNLLQVLAWLSLAKATVFKDIDFTASDAARKDCEQAFVKWKYIDKGVVDSKSCDWLSKGEAVIAASDDQPAAVDPNAL